MSSLTGNPPITIIDARQSWSIPKHITSLLGPSQIQYTPFTSQNSSTSNQVYTVQVPDVNTGVCTNPIYHWIGTFTLTGVNLQPQYVTLGLSDCCVDQVISNETLQIGGYSVNVQRSTVGVELNRVNMDSIDRTIYASGNTSSYPDFATSFIPWVNSNRNPLNMEYDVPYSDSCPQPRTSDVQVVSFDEEGGTYINYQFEIWFPSMVSPFNGISAVKKPAIRNLNNIQFQLTFESNLARFVSIINNNVGTTTIGDITDFSFTQQPEIWMTFITPAIESLMHLTEDADIYNYYQVQNWPTVAKAVRVRPLTYPSTPPTIQFALQQLSGTNIPKYFIGGCRPVVSMLNGTLASEFPRYYLPIADYGFNLQFNNTTVLNNITQYETWRMSVENGLRDCTFEQFAGRDVTYNLTANGGVPSDVTNFVLGGNIIIIDPAKDFQISAKGLTNGTLANWALSGSITFQNQSYNQDPTLQVEMFLFAVYEGFLISNGSVTANTGLLTISETKASFANPMAVSSAMSKHERSMNSGTYTGNGFFSNLFSKGKALLGKVANFAYKHKDLINQGLDLGKQYLGSGHATDTSQLAIRNKTLRPTIQSRQPKGLKYLR